jgi:hypothetical protein
MRFKDSGILRRIDWLGYLIPEIEVIYTSETSVSIYHPPDGFGGLVVSMLASGTVGFLRT